MAFLEIKNLSFKYPKEDKLTLNNINLSLLKGDFCFLLGKSGSGKSTLLKLLKKEIAPFGTLNGEIDIKTEKIAFVNQNVESNIVTDTVIGELAFALENSGAPKEKIELRIAEIASYFNLLNIIDKRVENLSGGEKQMLSLASAVSVVPEILILDEPISQLDPVSAENFLNTVLKLNKDSGITIILCEQRAEKILPQADKVVYLDDGEIKSFGNANEVADYLINNDLDMKEALPPFTEMIKGHPLLFSSAVKEPLNFKEKNYSIEEKNDNALTAKNISFAYKKNDKDVLLSLDFTAERGKINAILGANGSGKTTLLKCLFGINKCYGGKIRRNGKMAYMPQNVITMFSSDTVLEELKNDEEMLEKFDLNLLKNKNPLDLSGGETQRLALAKIVKTNADIFLLDEPTKSMDAPFAIYFATLLKELCKNGKTIILVTHDIEFAGRFADNVSLLFNKKIVYSANRYSFFSKLEIYTTSLSKLTNGRIISIDDIEELNEN